MEFDLISKIELSVVDGDPSSFSFAVSSYQRQIQYSKGGLLLGVAQA